MLLTEPVQKKHRPARRAIIGTVVAVALVGVMVAFLIGEKDASVAGALQGSPQEQPVDDATLNAKAGPTSGPACPVDSKYLDKATTGMRKDAALAWELVRSAAQLQGVTLCLFDGKRSAAQQQDEFDAAVRQYGSAREAGKRVLTPEKSMHVKGLAVDVQPRSSASWLERTAGQYGWCRRYDNEYWHFEYDAGYATAGCPKTSPSAAS